MRFTAPALALAIASGVSAHTIMFSVFVNGVDQGDGRNVYIRSPPNNSPVKDLASPDIVCNVNGGKAVGSFVKATPGDTLTFEWFHDNRGDDIIDGSHKGPIITYIAPFTSGNGVGSIWTKIAQEGFDSAAGKWAVDKLIANKGKKDFVLPAGLKAGKYLIRQEIIAHHESDTAFNANPARGAQFYPSCVQIEVTGSGTGVPSQNFNFNTGYTYADPGIVFNLYASFTSYKIPGPAVVSSFGSGSAPTTTQTTTAPVVAPTPSTTKVVFSTFPAIDPTAIIAPTPASPTAANPVDFITFSAIDPTAIVAPTVKPTTTSLTAINPIDFATFTAIDPTAILAPTTKATTTAVPTTKAVVTTAPPKPTTLLTSTKTSTTARPATTTKARPQPHRPFGPVRGGSGRGRFHNKSAQWPKFGKGKGKGKGKGSGPRL